MKFEEMTILEYEGLLASKKSTPGGGSCLALVLANAISLCQMVYNFTVDKQGYESVREEMISINNRLEVISKDAYRLMNEDSESFIKLIAAYKSKDEKAIADASLDACEVPYQLYVLTKEVHEMAKILSTKGNKNVVSDSMIAEDLCASIYHGCTLNIKANIKSIQDEDAKKKYSSIL